VFSKMRPISGQNSRISASVVIEPTRPFDQNTRRSPAEPIITSTGGACCRAAAKSLASAANVRYNYCEFNLQEHAAAKTR